MPSLENRSIHPLGSSKAYPRRSLAVSHRSLPRRYCCSHSSKHKWRSFDWLVCHSFHKERAVFSYTSKKKRKFWPTCLSPFPVFPEDCPHGQTAYSSATPSLYWDTARSGISRKHLQQCRQHREQTGGARKTMYSYRETTSLGSQRHGQMVHTTEALQWMDTGSSGKAGKDSEEGDLPFIWESSGMHGTLPGDGSGASRELMGHD